MPKTNEIMFKSRVALPSNFFPDENAPSKNWFSKHVPKNTEHPEPLQSVSFGRVSQIVKRKTTEFLDDSDDEQDSLDVFNGSSLSPQRFYEDSIFLHETPKMAELNTTDDSLNISNLQDETYKGLKSLKELPHPSQLFKKKKKFSQCKKSLGFDVDYHFQQVQAKSKELITLQHTSSQMNAKLFPAPSHAYKSAFNDYS